MDKVFADLQNMKPIDPHKVNYPEGFTFWKRNISDEDRLNVINAEDFPLEELLSNLGITDHPFVKSFGITDKSEIHRRLRTMATLMKSPELCKLTKQPDSWRIPTSTESFLLHFGVGKESNPFWQFVKKLIATIDDLPKQASDPLTTFANTLKQALPLEEQESAMAEVVRENIFRSSFVEGVAQTQVTFGNLTTTAPDGFRLVESDEVLAPGRKIVMDLASGNNFVEITERELLLRSYKTSFTRRGVINAFKTRALEIHGFRQFSSSLVESMKWKAPAWTNTWWSKLLFGIGPMVSAFLHHKQEKARVAAMQSQVITKLSDSLESDLATGITEVLNRHNWEKVTSASYDYEVTVYFRYDENGLHVRLLHMMSQVSFMEKIDVLNLDSSYRAYSAEVHRAINAGKQQANSIIDEQMRFMRSGDLILQLQKQSPDIFTKERLFSSNRSDITYRWFAISNLLSVHGLQPTWDACNRFREFVHRHCADVQLIAELLQHFQEKANEWKAQLCIPEILDDDTHLVSFNQLYPTHLQFKKGTKPVAITCLPSINGDMVGLSGFHGGGKSVTELTIAIAIYLAQSGLPVFGDGVKLNVKKQVGLVFIARGDGSTCQLLLRKTRNILTAAQIAQPNEMIVMVDELGGGTQEIDGLSFGKRVLNTLADKGISVVYSTQITALHEHAANRLGARVFKFDARHRITPGIGTGDMPGLIQREKLSHLLASDN